MSKKSIQGTLVAQGIAPEKAAAQIADAEGKQRKVPVRSPLLFPAYSFGEACKIAERIERLGGGTLTEESLAVDMGSSNKSSGFRLKRLTAGQFKVVEKNGDNLVTTHLAKGILKPISDDEKNNAIRQSFLAIPLFNAIANKYKGQPIPSGDSFKNVLEREFKIPSDRVAAAERVFTDSAREAGLLTVSGGNTYLVVSGPTAPPATAPGATQANPPGQVNPAVQDQPEQVHGEPTPPMPPAQTQHAPPDDELRRLYVKKLIDNIPVLNTQGKDMAEVEAQNRLVEAHLARIEKLLKLNGEA